MNLPAEMRQIFDEAAAQLRDSGCEDLARDIFLYNTAYTFTAWDLARRIEALGGRTPEQDWTLGSLLVIDMVEDIGLALTTLKMYVDDMHAELMPLAKVIQMSTWREAR